MANPTQKPEHIPERQVPPAGGVDDRPDLDPDHRMAPQTPPHVVNRVEAGAGNTALIIGVVLLVLAVIGYFVLIPTGDEPATSTDVTITEQPAESGQDQPAADAPAASTDADTPAGSDSNTATEEDATQQGTGQNQ